MSDGNFNRNLLPYNNFRSGFNSGQAQTKQKALDAFRAWLPTAFPLLTAEERQTLELDYKKQLDALLEVRK